jgi:hypothetical protein
MNGRIGLAISIFLVGCGGSEPSSGQWHYDGQQTEGCGNADDYLTDPDGSFDLVNQGGGKFTIDPGDGTGAFDCTISGSTYECPDRLAKEVDIGQLGGGTVSIHARVDGDLGSSDSLSGKQSGTMSCDGAGCGSAESYVGTSFPCDFNVEFDAELVQAR